MSELTSTLKVTVDGSGAVSGAAKVNAAVNSMAQNSGSSINSLNNIIKSLNATFNSLSQNAGNLINSLNNRINSFNAAVNSMVQNARNLINSLIRSFNTAFNFLAQNAGNSINSLNNNFRSFNNLLKSAQESAFNFLKHFVNTAAIESFTHSLIEANREFSSFIALSKSSNGSIEGAMESFKYVEKVSNTLGVSLEANLKAFGKLEAAMKPVDKTGELTKHVFEGISVAASALHLNSMQVELAFLAIQQAVSKNKPSLEEFQRQLSEHIPGSMAHLAEGVYLKINEIHDAISKGKKGVLDLVVGLANELKKTFGDAAEYASKQLPAALERMRNAILMFKVEISNAGAAEGIKDVADAIIGLTKNSKLTAAIGSMFRDLGKSLANFIRSITPQDIANFQKSLQFVISIIIEFIKNIKLIFEMFVAGIIGRYLGLVLENFLKLRGAAIAAGGGLTILSGSVMVLRAALGGPGGLITLLLTLVPLLYEVGKAHFSKEDDSEKLKEKYREFESSTKSLNRLDDLISRYKNHEFPDPGGKELANLQKLRESTKNWRNKLASELNIPVFDNSALGDIKDLLNLKDLPNDPALGNVKKAKKDPLEKYINETDIMRAKEYNSLLDELDKRFKNGDPTKLGRQQYELWVQTREKITKDFVFDVFGDGAFKTFDQDTANMIKSQQDSYNELQAEIAKEAEEFEKLKEKYAIELQAVNSELFGDAFVDKFGEVTKWVQKEISKINSLQIDPKFKDQLIALVNEVGQAKNNLAEIKGVRESFSKSQSIISSKEQELQSQVLTGLISETEARITLRKVIGDQGKELQANLLPIIEHLISTTKDPAMIASLKAMSAEIKKMVEIGSQTTAFKGLIDGLKEVANFTTDTYTGMKEVVVHAFKSLEDAVVEFVTKGKISMSDFVNSIKADMARLFAKEFVSKPLSQAFLGILSNSKDASGSNKASGGDNSGIFGSLGNLFSLGSTLLNPGSISLGIGGVASSIAEFAGATSGVATGIGAFVAQAVPIIGTIVALGSILGVFGGKPSNKAAFGDINLDTSETHKSEMTGKKAPSEQTKTARDTILQSIGGWASILKQLGGALTDVIRVDVGERDGIQFAINNGPMKNYGSDSNVALKKLFEELAESATGLAEPFKTLITNFKGAAKELLNFGLALVSINTYIKSDILTAAEELSKASKTTNWETWAKSVNDINELTKAFDGSSDSATKLANASLALYKQELDLIVQIKNTIESITSMFNDTIKGIQYDMLKTNEEKYNYLRNLADQYMAELQTATDPAKIAELTKLINGVINQSWGLLDPAQRALLGEDFIKFTKEANDLADERLNLALEKVVDTHKDIVDNIGTALASAAEKMQAAADTMQAAADTPVTVNVNVDVQSDNGGFTQFAEVGP